jgi:hypothetical protein
MSAPTTAITVETLQDSELALTMSTTETATAVLKSCHALYLPIKQGCQLMFMPKQPSHANSQKYHSTEREREREREREKERESESMAR